LWQASGEPPSPSARLVGFRAVFTTTLLNPKALIFAFAILPPGADARLSLHATLFLVFIGVTGVFWIAIGDGARRASARLVTPAYVGRAGALTLAGFALLFVGSVLAG
jgi:threonine/homoserine/homoserine lactone efflux protein